MTPRSFTLIALAVVGAIVNVHALPEFVARIPNGGNVDGVLAVGHADPSGSDGELNAFGQAFEAAGNKWTKALCEADSDGDGQTNGQELGDPCCKWTAGGSPQFSSGVSDPGVETSMADPSLWSSISCSGSPPKVETTPAPSTTETEPEETPEAAPGPSSESTPESSPEATAENTDEYSPESTSSASGSSAFNETGPSLSPRKTTKTPAPTSAAQEAVPAALVALLAMAGTMNFLL